MKVFFNILDFFRKKYKSFAKKTPNFQNRKFEKKQNIG